MCGRLRVVREKSARRAGEPAIRRAELCRNRITVPSEQAYSRLPMLMRSSIV